VHCMAFIMLMIAIVDNSFMCFIFCCDLMIFLILSVHVIPFLPRDCVLYVRHCQHFCSLVFSSMMGRLCQFSLSGSNPQDRHLVAGRNGVKRLRTVS
jgi:hypothetical protein